MSLSKSEYYLNKCREFEEKYGSSFSDFKKKVETNPEEVFSDWDDLMVWEGYELAHLEWKRKYEELRDCRK